MAGAAATKNRWPWKLLASALVVVLYFLPFYQQYGTGSPENWLHLNIIPTPHPEAKTAVPYFSENFVNQARPGRMTDTTGEVAERLKATVC